MTTKQERQQAAKSKTPSSEDQLKPFEEAYNNYLAALQEAWSYDEAKRRLGEANSKYARDRA